VPIVHGLEKDYAGRMRFEVVKYNEGDSPQRIKDYGIDKHGMLIVDQDKKKVWVESGHHQTRERVEAEIKKLLPK
jgi:hypothetical protein